MRNSKRIKIVAGGTAVLFGAGVAFAAWTSTGTSEDGTATAGDAAVLGVSVEDITGLYPTGTFPIDVTVTNTNPYNLALNSITFVSGTSEEAGCEVALTGSSGNGYTDVLAPGAAVTKPLSVSMSNAAEPACQDAVFDVVFSASGTSSAADATVSVAVPE